MKKSAYDLLEGDSLAARILAGCILVLIVSSVISATFEPRLTRLLGKEVVAGFELCVVLVFTVEYMARVWVSDYPRQSNPRVLHRFFDGMRHRARHVVEPTMVVDLLAILPFYVDLLTPHAGPDLLWIRLIRVFRVFRLFRLSRYSAALTSLGLVLKQRARELVVLGFVVAVILVISANLLWEVEGNHPEVALGEQNSSIKDVGDTFWWSVVTITSTGYGDILPKSPTAKILATVLMVLGVGFVAVPAGLVGASLLELTARMTAERWKHENYDGHIILCGWNESAEPLLKELSSGERDKVVIISLSKKIPASIVDKYKVVREDFTKDSVLRRVVFREPTWSHPCMILLAETAGRPVEDVDARTLMATMLAERIAKEQKGELDGDPLYTITQMLDEDNARALKESVVTANEVFVSGDVIGSMIASSAAAAGSSGVLIELFSSNGENQLFSARAGDLPNWKEDGATYSDLVGVFRDKTAIPLGFARAGLGALERVLNPDGSEVIRSADDLVYYVSRRRLY